MTGAANDADRLRFLADLVPVLEARDADFGHWETPSGTLGYFVLGPAGEALQGAVIRLGQRHGVPTPWMDAAYAILQPWARRNALPPEARAPFRADLSKWRG